MPLKLTDNTKLSTGQTSVLLNATPVSYSVWVRLDRLDYWADDGMGRMLGCGDLAHSNLMIHDRVTARWTIHSGSSNNSDYIGSAPLVHGVIYHVAFTVADGDQKLYINGRLVASASAAGVDGNFGDGNSYPFEIACPDGVTAAIQEPVVWVGYKLTANDVISIRDGASPATISASNIKWHLTLSGSNGSTASVGDSGLLDVSSSGLNVATIAKHGGGAPTVMPTYEGSAFVYTPPSKVLSAFVAPSRKGIVFLFSDRNGVQSNLAALYTNPTLTTPSLNGGAPLSLANGIWGVTQPAYSPWLYYPLPGPISSNDSPVLNSSESWADTSSGEVERLSNHAVNNSGIAILPPFSDGQKSMKVGYNSGSPPSYWSTTQANTNFARRIQFWSGASAGLDSNFYPLPTNGSRPTTAIAIQVGDNTVDAKRALIAPTGTYTVMWDGMGTVPGDPTKPYVQLSNGGEPSTNVSNATLVDVAPPGQTKANNKITQVVSQDTSVYWSPAIYFGVNADPYSSAFTNLRIFPPGSDENSPTFHSSFMKMIGGSDTIRVMSSCGGDGSIIDFSDYLPESAVGYNLSNWWPSGTVASVGPTPADAMRYFGNQASALITFSSPHGYRSGQRCTPYIPGPLPSVDGTGVGSFPANTGGGVIELSWNSTYVVMVLDDHNLVLPYGGNNTVSCTLDKTYYAPTPHPTDGSWACNGPGLSPGIPPAAQVALANASGSNLYFNIAPTSTDACVTEVVTLLASRLNPGKKLYIEYGNEFWNYSSPGETPAWCHFNANHEGIDYIHWYTRRMGQVHALAYSAMSALGRGGDLVRVFGSQAANPGGITAPGLAYAAANSIPIDAIAIAPYFGNEDIFGPNRGEEWSIVGAWDSLDPDQILDIGDLNVLHGHIENDVRPHSGMIGPGTPWPNTKLICYEGGPDRGLPISSISPPHGNDRKAIWTRHPRFRGIMLHYMQILQDNGVDLFIDFYVGGEMSSADGWSWPAYYAWNQDPGMGDGSDGKYDNRTSWSGYPTIHWDYPNLVSVVGEAINHWRSLVSDSPPQQSHQLTFGGPLFGSSKFD